MPILSVFAPLPKSHFSSSTVGAQRDRQEQGAALPRLPQGGGLLPPPCVIQYRKPQEIATAAAQPRNDIVDREIFMIKILFVCHGKI